MKLRLLCLVFAAGCARGVVPGGESFEFTDGRTFKAVIPFARVEPEKTSGNAENSYSFRDTSSGIEIVFRVRDAKGKEALFQPAYEPEFLAKCGCAVLRRGVVHSGGFAARDYAVTLEGGAKRGYFRHIGMPENLLMIEAAGASDQDARIQQMFQSVSEGIVILER